MVRPPTRFVATVAVAIVVLASTLAMVRPLVSDGALPRAGERLGGDLPWDPHGGVLAQLALDERQREQIERLRDRERRRIDRLRRALAETEQELRRRELARPFDAGEVNELVAYQAELAAYLRGTESRLIAEIGDLLNAEQRRRFAELRAAAPAAPGGSPRNAPREPMEASTIDLRDPVERAVLRAST